MSLVQNYNPDACLNNVMGLAESTKYFNVTTILTTSREYGPNGIMLPEPMSLLPNSIYIARPGQTNAWDDERFVKASKQSKRTVESN
ncbi:hypothetical protein [Parasitella parasitica]|uniref:Uncharacterized protein n=1 Tax=Parasitella parasitica TaxID=35722 RepID=A0A0B7N895_9FUNG|nr:hypothetical protein [Parasitella parasitica]